MSDKPSKSGLTIALDALWFEKAPAVNGWRHLDFEQEVEALGDAARLALEEIHLQHMNVAAKGTDSDYGASPSQLTSPSSPDSREPSTSDLARTLQLAMISEHVLDKLLLLPREMRERDLAEIAKSADLDPEELRSFYFRWHSEYRKRFYEADDES